MVVIEIEDSEFVAEGEGTFDCCSTPHDAKKRIRRGRRRAFIG